MSQLKTMEQVAQWLQLSNRTLAQMVRNGDIPATKIGGSWRFEESEIQNYINAHKTGVNKK